MAIDIEAEKREYCRIVNITQSSYHSDYEIENRIRGVFSTFARALWGRSKVEEFKRQSEMQALLRVVKNDVIDPIRYSVQQIAQSQAEFDDWHNDAVNRIKSECPITWDYNSRLTVGMAQKLINLHCKDLWALNIANEAYAFFFHPIIDRVTLGILNMALSWTRIDSYKEYMEIQLSLREKAKRENTSPLGLECWNWNKNR